jgi:hypothetical protein
MPFPTSRQMLANGLSRAQSQASTIKRIAENNRDRMAAGPITAGGVVSLMDNLSGALSVFQEVSALPGIAAYAQEQLGEDVSADFAAMSSATQAARNWIVTALPKDGDGYLLLETMDASGNRTERTFGTAATAGLRTALDALIATIE